MSIEIIKYPLSTEKSIRKMESDNTLVFIVEKNLIKMKSKKLLKNYMGQKF